MLYQIPKNPGIWFSKILGSGFQSNPGIPGSRWGLLMSHDRQWSYKQKMQNTHTSGPYKMYKEKKVYTFWSTWIWLFLEGENCTWSDWTRHNPLLYSISFINRDQIRLDIIQLNHVVFSNTKCVETYVKVQIGSDFSSKERNAPGQIGQDMICAWSPFFMTSYLIGWEYQTILSMTHIKFKLVEK